MNEIANRSYVEYALNPKQLSKDLKAVEPLNQKLEAGKTLTATETKTLDHVNTNKLIVEGSGLPAVDLDLAENMIPESLRKLPFATKVGELEINLARKAYQYNLKH